MTGGTSKLGGKVAIITGAGRGIGRATALKLAADGASVLVNDLDAAPAEATAAEIAAGGGRAVPLAGDVAAPDFGDRLIGAAEDAFGRIDIVVNNAGYIWNTTIQNNTDDQWYAMIDVHATAQFRILRSLATHLRRVVPEERRAGLVPCRKVVNISSVSGLWGAATQVSYAAAKMAVVGITNSLAREWGRYNVTVNCIAFGHIDTRLTQRLDEGVATIEVMGRDFKVGLSPDIHDQSVAATPLGRYGTPEDAAGGIYLFCIPESDFVSGQTLIVAGGRLG